jgi:DNA-binding transcriptional ArsR family regulator
VNIHERSGRKKMTNSKTGQIAEILSDKEIINYENVARIIKEKIFITQNEIREATSLSKGSVSQIIKKLRDEGLVILIKEKRGRQSLYKWVGGISAIEDELQTATTRHISASLLAESYDALITDAFALFSVLFDGSGWEVVSNIKEGLTDTEIHQFLGNDISLDSIRRILVICDAHNLIKINRIRGPAGSETLKLFEPLYRIDSVNKDYLEYMILIRGLASAVQFRMTNQKTPNYSHIYEGILNKDIQLLAQLKEKIMSKTSNEELELLIKLLSNYDYAPDMDRVYRNFNWRIKLNQSKNLKIDQNDRLIISDSFINKY